MGFAQRLADKGGALDVLVCENGVQAPDILRSALLEQSSDDLRAQFDSLHGMVRTSIGRMVPAGNGEDLLDITVEPYRTLPVEQTAFRGAIPDLPGLKAKPDFDLVLRQKLYIHNATHACLAYAGLAKGLVSVPDCMEDSELVERMRAVGSEVSAALAAAHGSEDNPAADIEAECLAMVDDLCHRYQNRPLGDPLARVARDPVRKLSADDRLIGAARLCEQQGIKAQALAQHILLACAYTISDDEPQADLWRELQEDASAQLARTSHRI